jgi:hypothetical protein
MPAKRTDDEIRRIVKGVLVEVGLIKSLDQTDNLDDCYKISTNTLKQNGLAGILNNERFKGSAVKCIMFCFPEYNWEVLKFEKKPQGFWKIPENIRLVLEDIKEKKGWTIYEDFYQLSKQDIPQGLHDRIPSVIKILKTAYPDYPWDPIFMDRVPAGTWDNFQNHIAVVKFLEKKYRIHNPKEWYTKLNSDIFNNDFGSYLLEHYYDWSPTKLICKVYPELESKIWLFGKCPQLFWQDPANVKQFLSELFRERNLKNPTDWYTVTCDDFDNFGGAGLVNIYKGHINTIVQFADVPSDFQWNRGKFRSTWTTERMVGDYLATTYKILRGPEFSPDWLKSKTSPYKMDVTICDNNTCVEIDGPGHFKEMWYGPHDDTFTRDIRKMKLAVENGYSGIRLYQPDVLENTFDWKTWTCSAIDKVKASEKRCWVFPANTSVYERHIQECHMNDIPVILV